MNDDSPLFDLMQRETTIDMLRIARQNPDVTTMTDDTTDTVDRDRIVISGHAEARDRLIELGRSEPIVDQLEGATGFYEFAAATADAVKHHRRHETDTDDLTDEIDD